VDWVGINVMQLYLIGLSFNLPLFRMPWPNQNDELTLGLNVLSTGELFLCDSDQVVWD